MKPNPRSVPSPLPIGRYLAMAAPAWLSLAAATAQTTYIVDDDGGPGVDFLEIQDALDVAGFTDVVEVRAGSYDAFTMSSPTRLLGAPRAIVADTSEIVGIHDGQWTVVSGLQLGVCRG